MKSEFGTDEVTQRILEIAVYFLQKYFGYTETQATEMMKRHYENSKWNDDSYHYEGAFRIAASVHYVVGLGKDPIHFVDWLRENNVFNQPSDAAAYFREEFYRNIFHRNMDSV
ncbi:MAG: hypothetical protein ACYDBJ_21040 [Aggregatilineales bacterium]